MWECLKGRGRRKEINQIPGSVKVKERARDEEFEIGGASHWNSTMWSFQELENQKKTHQKTTGFGNPWEQSGITTNSQGHWEVWSAPLLPLSTWSTFIPQTLLWQPELKIASLDELESGRGRGGKKKQTKKYSSRNVYFWEEPEEEEERSGFNALFRACKEIITGAKTQEGEDGGRARDDNLKDFFFFLRKGSLKQLGINLGSP